MTGLSIGAAELAEIERGAPAIVLAPGMSLPPAPPLLPLLLRDGALARPGASGPALPMPRWCRLLAIYAPTEQAAEPLRPMLPAGLPVVTTLPALLTLMAEALARAETAAQAAEAARDALKRALAGAPPAPKPVLDLAPAGPATLPARQPLGRPAEGLCSLAVHVAAPGGGLGLRLLAGGRVLGQWRVPGAVLDAGWLVLDLPEPAPPSPAEAVLDISGEGEAALSASVEGPLALRAWIAGPGWSALPRWFDWSAAGAPAPTPGLPLPVGAAQLATAKLEPGSAELVAVGEEAPRLLLTLPPGEARLRLSGLLPGPADLLRLVLSCPEAVPGLAAALTVTGMTAHHLPWRPVERRMELALPLPAGPTLDLALALRHAADGAATVELSWLALAVGAEGAPRPAPPAQTLVAAAAAPRVAVGMPMAAATLVAPGWRTGPPAPRLTVAGPGAAIEAAPRPEMPLAPLGATSFQDVAVNQHLVNTEGTYRHLDIGLSGLVSGGGLWRQLRFKLFDRRGVIGLEFREMKGWPQMFDAWPTGGIDNFGPFWRLETEDTPARLTALRTPHDRALIAALVEVLPDVARAAAQAASLSMADADAWMMRARALAEAVSTARSGG